MGQDLNMNMELLSESRDPDLEIHRPEILIVDDCKENLIALRRILKDVEAGIIQVTDGNQALTATLDHDFALAVLDVQMPGMDGYELAGLLRGDRKTSRLPIIFLTAAYGEEQHVFKGYEAGAVDYIVKPYNPAMLISKINVFLELHRKNADLSRKVEALAASEKKYRELVETANSIIIRWDNQGLIRFVNEYGLRFFGYSAEELLGRTVMTIMSTREETGSDLDVLVKGILDHCDQHVNVPSKNIRKDGQIVWVAWSNKAITDERGNVREILAIGNDITKLKRLEEDLMRRARNLDAANRELESFSYSVSHDLRAPLRIIKGFSSVLLEDYADKLDTQGQDFLSRIMRGVDKMGMLIDDLLNLSKISLLEMIPGIVDLSGIAHEVVNELRQAEPNREVEIVIENELNTRGDQRLLKVALTNLIGNAWKYTSKTSKARIDFVSMGKDDRKIYYVRDNGVGFDMKHAAKLFAPFQRLHTESEFHGTGIGLAIVNRIIQRHGGRIWAESEIGKGATFYFTLHS